MVCELLQTLRDHKSTFSCIPFRVQRLHVSPEHPWIQDLLNKTQLDDEFKSMLHERKEEWQVNWRDFWEPSQIQLPQYQSLDVRLRTLVQVVNFEGNSFHSKLLRRFCALLFALEPLTPEDIEYLVSILPEKREELLRFYSNYPIYVRLKSIWSTGTLLALGINTPNSTYVIEPEI